MSFETSEELVNELRNAIKPALCRVAKPQDYVQAVLEVRDLIDELHAMGKCKIERITD